MATKKKAVKKKVAKKEKAVKIPFPKALKKAPKAVPSKFYTFRQNNSFGRFDYDAGRGISVNVIVEADNVDDANSRAERIGLYFDGAGDCTCCGTRWSAQYEWQGKDDSTEKPMVYDEIVEAEDSFPKQKPGEKWAPNKWNDKDEYEGFIHYKDGRVVGFWK